MTEHTHERSEDGERRVELLSWQAVVRAAHRRALEAQRDDGDELGTDDASRPRADA